VEGGAPDAKRNLSLYASAIGAGLAAGLLAVAFERALLLASRARVVFEELGPFFHGIPFSMLCSALLTGASVLLVLRFDPDCAGSGIPQVEAALSRGREFTWPRTLLVKFASGTLAIAGGLTLGREGPTVQMGAAGGRALGRGGRLDSERTRVLLAAGAGAGLAAAFNAPIAGTVFVLEELKVLRSVRHAVAALLAAATADGVCRWLLNPRSLLGNATVAQPPVYALVFFLIVGAAAGLLAAVFNRGLVSSLDVFARLSGETMRRKVLLAAAVGALVGFVGSFEPGWLGNGESLIMRSLELAPAASMAAAILAVRFGLTLASYSTGAAGGLFAPLLVLGCQAGLLMSFGASALIPAAGFEPAAAAIVCMGALFAGSVQAPLTGVLLMVEMTGAFRLLLPLLVAAVAARFVARALQTRPIYEVLLERLLDRNGGSGEKEAR
jgi:CIC family chloride channel protein